MHPALADYQGRYKLEVNRAGASTYGTTIPELSIALCTEIVSLVPLPTGAHRDRNWPNSRWKKPKNSLVGKIAVT